MTNILNEMYIKVDKNWSKIILKSKIEENIE